MAKLPLFDIPDEYLMEIGKVAYAWSSLENTLDLCLVKLSNFDLHDPRSSVVFNHMTFPLKMDVLGTFLSYLQPTHSRLKNYQDIITQLKLAAKGRNFVMHAKWCKDPNSGEIQVANLQARGKLKFSIDPVKLSDLNKITETISSAILELTRLVFLGDHGSINQA